MVDSAHRTRHRLTRAVRERVGAADISGCGYGASIGNPIDGVPAPGEISATPTSFQNRGVYVQTHDSEGNLSDRPFHLTVTC